MSKHPEVPEQVYWAAQQAYWKRLQVTDERDIAVDRAVDAALVEYFRHLAASLGDETP